MSPPDFFIGWDRGSGRAQFRFLGLVAAGFLALLAGIGLLDGRDAAPRDLFGLAPPSPPDAPIDAVTLRGRVALHPYPTLFVAPDAAHPGLHSVLLSGDGKRGPQIDPALTDGAMVSLTGLRLRRGTIDMLVVGDAVHPLPEPPIAAPVAVSLGRWRVAGEICDGKCQTGAMQPGQGLSHRACASLCLIGGVPPVFVAASPVAGTSFLLLAGPDGRALPDLRRLAALPVVLEGEIERRGDLLIFKVDLAAARVL
jgi:hypothetical protein